MTNKLHALFSQLLVISVLFCGGCKNQNEALMSLEHSEVDTLVKFQHDWEMLPKGKINLSYQLKPAAGGDGFIHLENGHFISGDGSRFRIWGVNLTGGACYPDHEEATKVADLLSALGVNAVRLHFLDSNWGSERSIFRSDTNTTRALNPEQLEKLDYFVSELKKKGIYSNFNLNVGRTFREGDDVPYFNYLGMAKAVTLFDDRIIALQKEYAYQLLTHVNKYTGNEYRNEPALAFLEIVNENSLVEAWFRGHLEGTHNTTQTSTWIDIPGYYANELTEKYNQWLLVNLGKEKLLDFRKTLGLKSGQMVARLKSSEFENASDERFHNEARFIIETERQFYTGMYRFLKDSVKVNQLVAANSDHNHWKSGYALLSSTSKLDFVDGHVYWQHPRYFTDRETGRQTFSIENTPMVNDPLFSTVAQLSRSAVEGKPYTISETNHPYPNEYASEGIPILAAYGLLQDWDGVYFYTFEHSDPSEWKTKRPGYFDIMNDPVKIANLAAAGIMFHRGDVQPADVTVHRNYNEQDLMEGIRKGADGKPFFTPGLQPATPLVYRTRINSFSGGENIFPEIQMQDSITSETGELKWLNRNDNGLVIVDAPKTQAFIGFSDPMSDQSTTNLEVLIANEFASVIVTSMDGKEIRSSEKMLLTVTSTSILNNAEWNIERTSLEEWGELPFTIEPVKGKIKFKDLRGRKSLNIYPLDPNGMPMHDAKRVKIRKGEVVFEIGEKPAIWYLIER